MLSRSFLSPTSFKNSTLVTHYQAVEKVILTIREQLSESLSLQDMAEIANLSSYHFNRIFRQIVGIPPIQFLYALRIQAAKRLLLTTQLSVTDICFEVGYKSLGTFTTRFTKLVGLTPLHLRHLSHQNTVFSYELLHKYLTKESNIVSLNPHLSGRVRVSSTFHGFICVGIFSTPIPQGLPIRCTLMSAPGIYRITSLPDGRYYIFATAFPSNENISSCLLQDNGLRGVTGPILVYGGKVDGSTDITLRLPRLIEPPLLIALPFLLNKHLAAYDSEVIF